MNRQLSRRMDRRMGRHTSQRVHLHFFSIQVPVPSPSNGDVGPTPTPTPGAIKSLILHAQTWLLAAAPGQGIRERLPHFCSARLAYRNSVSLMTTTRFISKYSVDRCPRTSDSKAETITKKQGAFSLMRSCGGRMMMRFLLRK